ncbi:gamma carbonic anhydrase family protein [Marispirochaeta sp.]|uniref:gamma carbonic anhydrase family protein n=1 Tax=Marispirochaeta sp. TaxID=2038653 RepID=UPI0029C8DAD8|nr:gamma carbonic anhydrase family protein [Marispirochaeta sp.]
MSDVERAAFIAENATVTGNVRIEKDASVWYGASVRGDFAPIVIGESSNIQDNSSVHVDGDAPVSIGKGVTIGHNAVIHGCTIEDDCLIGMGAIILNRAVIGEGSIIGAGALVTEGKVIPPRSLAVGAPARVMREVSEDELQRVKENAASYADMARRHKAGEF